jgi:hypothetical protein
VKRVAIALACSACVGPKLVSTPMATSAGVAPLTATNGAEAPEDTERNNALPEELAGTWTGRAWQQGNKSWPLTVTFEKRGAEVVAHAQYPDQRCRAEWTIKTAEPRRWAGEENVTIDPFSRCPNHARVTLEVIDEDTINWRWIGPGGTATATLTHTQP